MARRPSPSAGAQGTPPDAPSPTPEILTGLEAIRAHGGRDEELRIDAGGFFEEAFMTERLVTAEDGVRLIKKVEQLVRSSLEYKTYIGHLRQDVGLNRCSFFPNVNVATGEVGLEMHHAPLTLYQLVEVILNHRLAQGHAVTSLTIADEVMQAHYAGLVGLVPLTETAHELVHAGALTLSAHMVHGDWVGLLRAYPLGVDQALLEQLQAFVEVTEERVIQAAAKLDSSQPRLREGMRVPGSDELRLLMMQAGGM